MTRDEQIATLAWGDFVVTRTTTELLRVSALDHEHALKLARCAQNDEWEPYERLYKPFDQTGER